MKYSKMLTLALGVIVISFLSSCSKDDSDDLVTNQISFDGKTYTMVGGLIEDYGSGSPADNSNSDTHYNYDFTIADVAFQQFTDEFDDIEYNATNATFGVYVELFSPTTTSFEVGTFSFITESQSDILASIEGNYFFSAAEAYIPTGTVDADGDPVYTEFEATGGTVTVSGSGPTNFTITYDLQFSGGKTLTGTYNASFIFSDETED